MIPTVSVLVHSFNRPRMLREALASVVAGRPDEVILVDDGSDVFEAFTVFGQEFVQPANNAGCTTTWRFVGAPPLTVAERMATPRQGRLLNEAMGLVTSDIITSLCDDDLHAPGWYDQLRAAWAADPSLRLVRGEWLVFQDGTTPSEADPPCPFPDRRRLTAGNFAWSARLVRERGCRWPENALNCLDNGFLISLNQAGATMWDAPTVGWAGWRREHPYTNLHWTDGWRHTPDFAAVLARGRLEP